MPGRSATVRQGEPVRCRGERLSVLPRGPRVVRRVVRRAHPRPARRLDGDRRRRPHADPGPHRLGQDAGGVPVGDRPARRPSRRPTAARAHPRALHLAAPRARGRRREEPARRRSPGSSTRPTASGRPLAHEPSVGVRTGDTPAERAAPAAEAPPGHPDHDAGVALPDADVVGARDAPRASAG